MERKILEVLLEDAVSINKEMKRVYLKIGSIEDFIEYDYLVVAVGTQHSYFGHNDWEKYAPGLKTLNDALFIREKYSHLLRLLKNFMKMNNLLNI